MPAVVQNHSRSDLSTYRSPAWPGSGWGGPGTRSELHLGGHPREHAATAGGARTGSLGRRLLTRQWWPRPWGWAFEPFTMAATTAEPVPHTWPLTAGPAPTARPPKAAPVPLVTPTDGHRRAGRIADLAHDGGAGAVGGPVDGVGRARGVDDLSVHDLGRAGVVGRDHWAGVGRVGGDGRDGATGGGQLGVGRVRHFPARCRGWPRWHRPLPAGGTKPQVAHTWSCRWSPGEEHQRRTTTPVEGGPIPVVAHVEGGARVGGVQDR